MAALALDQRHLQPLPRSAGEGDRDLGFGRSGRIQYTARSGPPEPLTTPTGLPRRVPYTAGVSIPAVGSRNETDARNEADPRDGIDRPQHPKPLARIVRDRQRLEDAALAGLYAAIFLGYTVLQLGGKVLHLPWIDRARPGIPDFEPSVVLFSRAAIAFVLVCALALAWRRTRPELSYLVILGVGAIQMAIGEPIRFWDVAMPIALFSAAAYANRSFARLSLVLAVLGYVAVWALEVNLLSRLDHLPNPVDVLATSRGASFVLLLALLILVWAAGDQVRAARERLERDLERTEELAREREGNARLGALAERHRIARELHDVVAHGLSVMIVQADGALYAEAEHPEAPRQALATIAATGRDALHEMRRLLGVLRDEPNAADRAPQPELASLPALIDRFREAGLHVSLTEEGAARAIPAAVGLTAYRVVQESLTNVLHHVGPTRVDVRLTFLPEHLEVEVVNEPGAGTSRPRGAAAGAGLGLVGMRERVGLLDGRMTAGPTPSGGFRVHVELPTDGVSSEPESPLEADSARQPDVPDARGPDARWGS